MKKFCLGIAGTLMLLTGCSTSNTVEIISDKDTAVRHEGANQICFQGNTKFSTIIKQLNKITEKDYKYDGGTHDDIYIHFKNKKCFNNISSLDFYMQTNIRRAIEVNTKKSLGIQINDIRIEDAINYFNAKGSDKKIVYYDDNIKLKNNDSKRLNNMNELKKYISDTTPFYFVKLEDSEKKVIYALRYKKPSEKTTGTNAIALELKKALELTKEVKTFSKKKKLKLEKSLETSINGVANYEDY